MKWKEVTLSDVSNYSKERINVNELTFKNYVSTENMLPEKAGKTIASSLPGGNVIKFKYGQTLISNIRPYFKKIWFATMEGGCSADVLAFDISEEVDSKYFYYSLSQDIFFDYVMAGSKGTKMPRGDKQQIMMYSLLLPDLSEQKSIVGTLSCLDDKIELNNRINKNLEEIAQAIFKSWFIDFEPFQDAEFEDSELGRIPKGWRVGTLGDISNITSGKRPHQKQDTLSLEMCIPVAGASCIMAYTNEILYNEKILITGRVGTHGIIQRFNDPCWASDNTLVIKSDKYEFVYQVLKSNDFKSMNRGSTQPLITQTDLKKVTILIPHNTILENFEFTVSKLMDIWKENNNQNQILITIRDSLLPKLMSGEIRVPTGEVK